MDLALIRLGCHLATQEFAPLPFEQAQRLAAKIGKTLPKNRSCTIAKFISCREWVKNGETEKNVLVFQPSQEQADQVWVGKVQSLITPILSIK